MNTESVINSIYNPKRKSKDLIILPKIFKGEATPPEARAFPRGASRKYNQQNIFKIEDEKKQKVRLHIEEERLRELRGKECEQLEARIAEMMRKHQQELKQIEQNEKEVVAQIDAAKQSHYQIKLNIWELKNQIMDLNGVLLEEESELRRLEALLPPDEGEYEEDEQNEFPEEGDPEQGLQVDGYENQEQEGEAQGEESSVNILRSLSQQENPIEPADI